MGMEHEGALKSNWMLSISGIKKVLAKYSGLTLVEITQLFRPRSLGRATWGGGGGADLAEKRLSRVAKPRWRQCHLTETRLHFDLVWQSFSGEKDPGLPRLLLGQANLPIVAGLPARPGPLSSGFRQLATLTRLAHRVPSAGQLCCTLSTLSEMVSLMTFSMSP